MWVYCRMLYPNISDCAFEEEVCYSDIFHVPFVLFAFVLSWTLILMFFFESDFVFYRPCWDSTQFHIGDILCPSNWFCFYHDYEVVCNSYCFLSVSVSKLKNVVVYTINWGQQHRRPSWLGMYVCLYVCMYLCTCACIYVCM